MGIKYKVDEEFFKKWTSEMAYVLGYLYADGSLENAEYIRGKYIRVSSIDKSSILKIKSLLMSKHTMVKIDSPTKNGHKRYLLRIGSHELYADLEKLGLYPNKSLTINFPDIPRKFLADFIRGYFDGDGCVHICLGKGKIQRYIIKKLSITFTCGSKYFLEKLSNKLEEIIETKNRKVYNGHRSYMLCYSTQDSLKIFKFLYGNLEKKIFLKRKFSIFKEYLSKRPQRIDREIANILRYLGNGRVAK